MASIAKNFSFIFLLTLLASLQIHARDGQFFNKVPSNNGEKETQTVVPNKEQEPNFMPENENGAYGLYGHDSVSTPVTNINNPNVNNLPNSKVHQQQGMSDTRLLGNGKFYYDINAEKHARDPYENAREFAAMNQQYNNRNSYGNNEFNNNNSFENEEEFQDEENMH
ncbi:hypothetical protein K7X08_033242 [Anisodus acutangulus]|uniref:Uncharacterized protein n=1 Tax=Anisodus acutangulus TaxID=402998 RepID=A0A9Q1M2A8_9SOLA|nr:hypothetical protein K7X08_033242 [Anisodus acutangulus]